MSFGGHIVRTDSDTQNAGGDALLIEEKDLSVLQKPLDAIGKYCAGDFVSLSAVMTLEQSHLSRNISECDKEDSFSTLAILSHENMSPRKVQFLQCETHNNICISEQNPQNIDSMNTTSKQFLNDTESCDSYQSYLMEYVNQTNYRIFVSSQLRNYNNCVTNCRPAEEHFIKLDSSVKKNAAFVKKLKTFTGSQIDLLLRDMTVLNLSKYISEVATALVEAKLKMVDVWPAVKLCNILHLTYPDFKTCLLDSWQKALNLKKEEKIENQAKLRVDLRFYSELINVGIFLLKESLPLLGNILTILTVSDREQHYNANIIYSFCINCGDDFAGLIPRKLKTLLEKYGFPVPCFDLLPKEKQQNVRALFIDYYDTLCSHRFKEYTELQTYIKRNNKILQTKGQLSKERKEKLEELKTSFDSLEVRTRKFAEILDVDVPTLPEIKMMKQDNIRSNENEEVLLSTNIWEDDETKNFYENIINLKDFLPGLQISNVENNSGLVEEAMDSDSEDNFNVDDDEPLMDIDDDDNDIMSTKVQVDSFLKNLSLCVNRELIDNACIDFIKFNTKSNRKKMIKTLLNVPRTRLDLVPMYSRFVATINIIAPDVGTELCQHLKQSFKYHVRKKDQMKIETKIKIVHFIAELVKFRIYSIPEALHCLKILIQDFTHHHIEMCCHLVESCGRYLLKHPESCNRMKVYLDQIIRKKCVLALDSRHVMMIENAYYCVYPPETCNFICKMIVPEYEFLKKILYQDMAKNNVEKILCFMRKIDWSRCDVSAYAIKCLTYGFRIKFLNIGCLANLVAGLTTYQEFVGPMVVDGVLEDIQLGMELNFPKYNQRRVAMIRYFGELYNYKLIESCNVFQVLYSLITFGVTWDHNIYSAIDPPNNLNRIRLVCVLLDCCGNYFVTGHSRRKLDTYLVFLQHYYWFKYSHPIWNVDFPFPSNISQLMKEILGLSHNVQFLSSVEESAMTVKRLCDEYASENLFLLNICKSHSIEDVTLNTFGYGIMSNCNNSESELFDQVDLEEPNILSSNSESEISIQALSSLHTSSESLSLTLTETLEKHAYDKNTDGITARRFSDETCNIIWETEETVPDNIDRYDSSKELDHKGTYNESELVNINLPLKSVQEDSTEDNEFKIAFEQMVSGNMQERMQEVKPRQIDIAVPLHVRANSKKTYEQIRNEDSDCDIVNFILMLKRGNKQIYKHIYVPINSDMALHLKNQEETERLEKERVKHLTLCMSARLEEEEYQEIITKTRKSDGTNFEKRQRYHHQKGVPDSDLIFGSKKMK